MQNLPIQLVTPENFCPYGQVISASKDGKLYDSDDAQLVLNNGIPRFYIMKLYRQEPRFHKITRHLKCTQCLGSLEGKQWLIAVAPPTNSDKPIIEDIAAFSIPGNCFIKLNAGTWHAGPYFYDESVDFYNLELSDTNINDHETCDLLKIFNQKFELI